MQQPEDRATREPFGAYFEGGRLAGAFEQLRDARDRVESILQVVVGDDGVVVQDFSGRIVYANEPAAQLLGAGSVGALLRMPAPLLLRGLVLRDEAGQDRSGALPGTAILCGGQPVEGPLEITAAGSEPRWVSLRTLPLRDDRGDVGSVITIFRDITEQRRTADFRESLLGIASHDLRGPLSAIAMSAAVLAKRPEKLDPQMAKMVQQIQGSTQRAVRMVHDLLDLTQARLGGGIPMNFERCDVRALVAAAVDEISAAHPQREVVLQCEAEAGEAEWDRDRISQVLGNLLGNAMTYGSRDRPVTVRMRPTADAVEVEVQNFGPVIPPDQLARVFEPFMRGSPTHHAQRSVGLGLYIVKEVVAGHGGVVGAESEADTGTTFTLRLPRARTAPAD